MERVISKKRVMVFGVFDRLHPGHISLLKQAAALGDELVVVVARDELVRQLKNKSPYYAQNERLKAIQKVPSVTKAVLGDAVSSSYEVIKKYKPEVLALGYDQKELTQDITQRMQEGDLPHTIHIVHLKSHRPNKLHSSLLRP